MSTGLTTLPFHPIDDARAFLKDAQDSLLMATNPMAFALYAERHLYSLMGFAQGLVSSQEDLSAWETVLAPASDDERSDDSPLRDGLRPRFTVPAYQDDNA